MSPDPDSIMASRDPLDDLKAHFKLPDGSTATDVDFDARANIVRGVRQLPTGRKVRFTTTPADWKKLVGTEEH